MYKPSIHLNRKWFTGWNSNTVKSWNSNSAYSSVRGFDNGKHFS